MGVPYAPLNQPYLPCLRMSAGAGFGNHSLCWRVLFTLFTCCQKLWDKIYLGFKFLPCSGICFDWATEVLKLACLDSMKNQTKPNQNREFFILLGIVTWLQKFANNIQSKSWTVQHALTVKKLWKVLVSSSSCNNIAIIVRLLKSKLSVYPTPL